jgi:hypothetical protein
MPNRRRRRRGLTYTLSEARADADQDATSEQSPPLYVGRSNTAVESDPIDGRSADDSQCEDDAPIAGRDVL